MKPIPSSNAVSTYDICWLTRSREQLIRSKPGNYNIRHDGRACIPSQTSGVSRLSI